ncbi:RNA/RNP complex-1-interacting phosphatase-like isoform X1 [Physeter macrocephalus]|uniref:RNA/RNP complex-1-interacting phosphatase-like isoform X1 n=1 Tax=Physeter macrocephalus TaxID=9755 RepID=A0A455C8Q9_PHYMC|nr:RNA/RNP complex-1-interacting phosphatase-like isoform X1 [Physeter catodon]|eukprot:XP_028352586.1 RNA/RNP complex-1-interacting phosphatase-like isoform X1 [Physeter catodon]
MSQWHHACGRWGQGRGFSGRSSVKRTGGKHIPERVLKRTLLQKNAFPPWIFFIKLREQNEELGLIIDLSYTRHYYKPESTFSCHGNTSSQQCLKFALFPYSNPSSSDSILLFFLNHSCFMALEILGLRLKPHFFTVKEERCYLPEVSTGT